MVVTMSPRNILRLMITTWFLGFVVGVLLTAYLVLP